MTPAGNWVSRWRVRAGYPLAIVFLLLAHPTAPVLLAGTAVAALGLLVRGAAAGHLHKHEQLAISGPYALTRNPLYFGSALLAAGFVIASASWIPAALVAAYFLAFYPAVMRREETELRARYGAAFEEYARRVPLFWPRFGRSAERGSARFSWAQYRRNREYQAALGALVGMALLATKPFWPDIF
jgi:hypothetical protein